MKVFLIIKTSVNFQISSGSTTYVYSCYEVELLEVWPVTIKLYVIKLQ